MSEDRSPYRYDVAFSLRHEDHALAKRIELQLNDLRTFLYTTKQIEIVGADGLELYTEVFRSDARLCVVLYRHGWGSEGFTSIEQDAIQERRLKEARSGVRGGRVGAPTPRTEVGGETGGARRRDPRHLPDGDPGWGQASAPHALTLELEGGSL